MTVPTVLRRSTLQLPPRFTEGAASPHQTRPVVCHSRQPQSSQQPARWRGGRGEVATSAVRRQRFGPYSSPGSGQGETSNSSSTEEAEPFDLALTVLFGLPALILLVPWVLGEPESVALLAPLLLLVPGPRDIARAVLAKVLALARDSIPNSSGPAASAGQAGPAAPPQRWPYRAAANRMAAAEHIEQPAQPGGVTRSGAPAIRPGPPGVPGTYWSAGQADPQFPATPQPAVYEDSALPSAESPSSVGWPGGRDASQQPDAGAWAVGPPPQPRTVVVGEGLLRGGRLVRGGGRGRVGIDLEACSGSGTPMVLRFLFAAFPFLKSWGGFM